MQNEKVAVYKEKNKLITTANQPNYNPLGFGYIPVYNKKIHVYLIFSIIQ